jgi:hypothetical protein
MSPTFFAWPPPCGSYMNPRPTHSLSIWSVAFSTSSSKACVPFGLAEMEAATTEPSPARVPVTSVS